MLAALKRWAEDEFRSTNGQLEYILREALRETGCLTDSGPAAGSNTDGGRSSEPDPRRSGKSKPASGR